MKKDGDWPQNITHQFTISFHGDDVKNHEIDADVLAKSLSGVYSVLNEANYELNGTNSEIFIKVKGSPEPGSFLIHFIAFTSSNILPVAADVIALTGFAGKVTDTIENLDYSLIGLYRALKGEKIAQTTSVGEDKVSIRTEKSGITIVARDNATVQLYKTDVIRREIASVVTPLEKDGIDNITFKGESNTEEVIYKNELPYFKPPVSEQINEIISEELLLVVTPNIEGDPKYWHFKTEDEGKVFTADIQDKQFLQGVKEKKYSFIKGTIIKVRLKTTQQKKINLRNTYVIEKVLDFYPQEQLKL